MRRKRVPGIIYLRKMVEEGSKSFEVKKRTKAEKLNIIKRDIKKESKNDIIVENFIVKEDTISDSNNITSIQNSNDAVVLLSKTEDKKYSNNQRGFLYTPLESPRNLAAIALIGVIFLKLKFDR